MAIVLLFLILLQMSKRTKTTSSSPSRSVRRFTSDEHEERFEKLIKRTIQPERFIRLSPGGTYRKLMANFEIRKWNKICEPEPEINYDIVREFYANALQLEEGVAFHYQTRVRGKIISFSRDAITPIWVILSFWRIMGGVSTVPKKWPMIGTFLS